MPGRNIKQSRHVVYQQVPQSIISGRHLQILPGIQDRLQLQQLRAVVAIKCNVSSLSCPRLVLVYEGPPLSQWRIHSPCLIDSGVRHFPHAALWIFYYRHHPALDLARPRAPSRFAPSQSLRFAGQIFVSADSQRTSIAGVRTHRLVRRRASSRSMSNVVAWPSNATGQHAPCSGPSPRRLLWARNSTSRLHPFFSVAHDHSKENSAAARSQYLYALRPQCGSDDTIPTSLPYLSIELFLTLDAHRRCPWRNFTTSFYPIKTQSSTVIQDYDARLIVLLT